MCQLPEDGTDDAGLMVQVELNDFCMDSILQSVV